MKGNIRELGLRRILKARSVLPRKTKNVRVFKLSALCFEANECFELIDWQKCEITEPPILSRISTQDLKDFMNNPESSHRSNFEKYHCHTQCVERSIKLVTEASAAVCGPDSRDGFIRVRADSRKNMPCFNTKSEFVIKK
ncbi:hypothetical protein RN001_009106 [Aquatica leii]|uniref:Uncharacterized protein n=1 Tax=Aquatica leii TaxID=1421715 RepID=A0AAN7SPR8_9COLE|nr:hypothetical protein RN001_009106 [Aquatica leii]